jgi:site-specific DNA-methyltransferase (adenine-specific)
MTSNILDGLRPLVVPIGDVQQMKGNPRRGDVDSVAKSLERFGQHRPIVVQQATGEILIGNHTHKAAIQLGWTEIAVLYTDDDRETAVARSLADNRTHDNGKYDNAELASLLAEVSETDNSLLLDAGFAGDEITALLQLASASAGALLEESAETKKPVEVKEVEVPEQEMTVSKVEGVTPGATSELFVGNCLELLAEYADNTFDSCVTDPLGGIKPAGERMVEADLGDNWWRWVPGPDFWSEIKRVVKPGGYVAVLAGTTTWHKVAVAAEDGGLELRDTLMWLFGTGMPTGIDIGMQVDRRSGGDGDPYFKQISGMTDEQRESWLENHGEDNPWYGWSTALKPAWKPILLFRVKPHKGSAAESVMKWGTGAMNIDACRVESGERDAMASYRNTSDSIAGGHGAEVSKTRVVTGKTTLGRWPATVVVDEEAAEEIGDVARFFVTPPARQAERNVGLPLGVKNDHPRVRPVELMKWLVRLVTPPGGVVLDPFCGSGTTGVAAVEEGMGFVGIDRNERWVSEIAEYRLAKAKEERGKKK